MIKKTILIALCIGVVATSSAQRKRKKVEVSTPVPAATVNDQLKSIHQKAYSQALSIGDVNTAIVSLNYLLALDTAKFSTYRDSLSILYFRSGNYAQSYSLSKTLSEENASNLLQLEIYAQSLRELGGYKEAIPIYEKLLKTKNSMLYAYQLGDMQLKLERTKEAFNTFRYAVQAQEDTAYNISTDAGNNQVQQVKLKAVVYNMLGVTAYQLNAENVALAYEFFVKAVMEQNDFVLARNNAIQTKKVIEEKTGSAK